NGDSQVSGAFASELDKGHARSSISNALLPSNLTPEELTRYNELQTKDSTHSTTDLFNAMAEGRDVEKYINSLPAKLQEHARRFVETDRQIHELDKQLAENNKNAKPTRFDRPTLSLPGPKSNYTEKLLKLPENATFDTTKPSPEVVAKIGRAHV